MTDAPNEWRWWCSSDAETYQGPHFTREDAIAAGLDYSMGEHRDESGKLMCHFYIAEARQAPLLLSDWIDVERMIIDADETLSESDRTAAECDEGPFFEVSSEQHNDLEARIKAACNEWQKAHALVFTCKTFSDSRNQETILRPAHPILSEIQK